MKTKLERMIIADMVKRMIKRAITEMMAEGEFDRIFKHPTSTNDRVAAIELKNKFSRIDIDDVPIIPLIMSIDSADVWKNIFVRMITYGEGENSAE